MASNDKKREGDSRQAYVGAVKAAKMSKKLKDLRKRYPENTYSIDTGKNGISFIRREKGKGRRPHKVKGWRAALKASEAVEATV